MPATTRCLLPPIAIFRRSPGPPLEIGTFSDLPVYAIGKGLESRGKIKLRSFALYKRAANHSNVASRMPSASSSFTVANT